MRVVGYVRDAVDPHEGEPSFSQSEKIRRWTTDNGHQLVAVCQDLRTPGRELRRDGWRALLGIVAAGETDAVIVSGLAVFSPDLIVQEVMIGHLRARGMSVLTGNDNEAPLLRDPCPDQIRLLVRDVIAKWQRHHGIYGAIGDPERAATVVRVDEGADVIVELVPAEDPAVPDLTPLS